ncbi:hypothetical protein OSH11_02440 [Kaistia dalseonensis]|uniref:Uncharacterized protein n=1 Tax=Kaistia dalseonensis TaxID=410840 RepID=A0ABU0H1E5_9HYPH|nr:hypothetical protein [Kaistia dalseonensis]MCX5493556.1 hypothetical protein [Kaistia dalseonensis]MDQ0436116.1 hypothetical protein [Kaistia dalseonensis]
MKTHRTFAFAALAAASLAAFSSIPSAIPAAWADPVTDRIAALDPSVQDVRIAGDWEKDGRKGVYRIVVSRTAAEKPTARLFVQWIAVGIDGSQTVDRTTEVSELVGLKLDIVDFVAETDPDGLSIFVETLDPANDTDQSYELFIDSDGSYRFGPASN